MPGPHCLPAAEADGAVGLVSGRSCPTGAPGRRPGGGRRVTAFLLGPTLSDLPAALEPHRRFTQGFVGPLVTVGGTRALLVAGCWGLALLVLSIVATTMREVRE
jgi:hypothetical protein